MVFLKARHQPQVSSQVLGQRRSHPSAVFLECPAVSLTVALLVTIVADYLCVGVRCRVLLLLLVVALALAFPFALLAFVDGANVHWRWTIQGFAGHDDAAYLLLNQRIRRKARSMHEHVASEVFVLNAFLDDCDLHAIGQHLVTISFVSSDLHLELVQRTSHVAFEGLGKNLAGSYSATSRRQLSNLRHHPHVPANVALNPPRARLTKSTTVWRLAGLWDARLSS